MKKNLLLLYAILANMVFASTPDNLPSLLKILDEKIKNKQEYIGLKEEKIDYLKAQKKEAKNTLEDQFTLNSLIYNEYKNYISDSAIFYLNLNFTIAYELDDIPKIHATKLNSALLFVRLGMYKEASDLLESISYRTLNRDEKLSYSIARKELNLGMGKYTQNIRERYKYWKEANLFKDSVQMYSLKTSDEFLKNQEKQFRVAKNFKQALQMNDERLALTAPYTALYAYITFHRSLIYREMGDTENELRYLILSAISDVQLAINDNASISILAHKLMQEGDINRAYAYIRFSLENIKAYNTRIRSSEILTIQTIIDQEYQLRNEQKNKELKALLAFSFVLLLLLAISIVYVYKQMKRGQRISRQLKEINLELEMFNGKLHQVNATLHSRNLEVAEANHIKEEYIAYFLDECSQYIVKLDDYRKMVYKKLQDRQYDDLFKISKNTRLKEEALKELFVNFDRMFINLFPDFLSEFNTLLLDEEHMSLKKEEGLNTELRIYALIRLGITDSHQIAKFLGYSVNTIYNYRTKMKNRSKVHRDHFESKVKKIGAFT